jgi:hypothetical protein
MPYLSAYRASGTKSFTAKNAKNAKEEKSLTAEDANPRRKRKALPRREQ